MVLPDDYWASFEHRVASLSDSLEAIRVIAAYEGATGSQFVWRGVTDASWPMHSSLVRAYVGKHGVVPTESLLRRFERSVIAEAREWDLDWHRGTGRLVSLELLATLQHFGVPTRLIDFTFNPLIALWFAVEADSPSDGRVFAIDASNRLVSRRLALRPDPWWWREPPRVDSPWSTESWVWRPPPLEERIVRQQGCFLTGGVPSTQPARAMRERGSWRPLRAAEVRSSMSVPFQLIGYDQAVAAMAGRRLRGQPPQTRAFTLRVENRAEVRSDLERAFGYASRSLFPDPAGLRVYGRSWT
jgi:hypothetical protein